MTFSEENIAVLITKQLPDADIQMEDVRGDGQFFSLHIASSHFEDLPRVDQFRMVYKALSSLNECELESLSIQTTTAC